MRTRLRVLLIALPLTSVCLPADAASPRRDRADAARAEAPGRRTVAGLAADAARAEAPGRRTVAGLASLCAFTETGATGWCAAYLMGAADLSSMLPEGNPGALCNANYKIEQLPRLYLAWAKRHAEGAGEDMVVGVSFALRESFPCMVRRPSGL